MHRVMSLHRVLRREGQNVTRAQTKAALPHSRMPTWTEQITALVHYCAGPSSSLKFTVVDTLAISMAAIN